MELMKIFSIFLNRTFLSFNDMIFLKSIIRLKKKCKNLQKIYKIFRHIIILLQIKINKVI